MSKILLLAITGFFPGTFACQFAGEAVAPWLTVPIEVAPQVVNLRFETKRCAAHADIPFRAVNRAGFKLSVDDDLHLAIPAIRPVPHGELVTKAKWHLDDLGDGELAELRERGSARVALDGVTTDGVSFSGTSTVRVILAGE